MASTKPWLTEPMVEFDKMSFARAITAARHGREMSTRDLARHADISQAYVVALERALTAKDLSGPTPTVEVLARIATVLGIRPAHLFEQSLRRVGRHVLVIADDATQIDIAAIRRLAGGAVETWLSAGSPPEAEVHSLQLRRNQRARYERDVIEASLQSEMRRLQSVIGGHEVGLVFSEMSAVMSAVDDPEALIAFELRWAEVVSGAARQVGAHAAWNVCVYGIEALRSLPDPGSSVIQLVRSHDTVWSIEGLAGAQKVSVGSQGVRRVAKRLCPPDTSERSWRAQSQRIVSEALLAS